MDAAMILDLQFQKAPFDDEEPGEKYFRDKAGKLAAEVYFWMDAKAWI
jgi:hypothetical protein